MCIQKWLAIYNVYTFTHRCIFSLWFLLLLLLNNYLRCRFPFIVFSRTHSPCLPVYSISFAIWHIKAFRCKYFMNKHFANARTFARLLVCSPCTQTSIYLLLWFWFQFSFLLHFVSVVTAVHFGGFPPSFFSRTRFFVVENFRKFNLFLCIHITHSHICILYYMADIFILSL